MSPYSAYKVARKYGYRSGLEDQLAEFLRKHKIKFDYEKVKIEWEDLAYRTYTPDFILDNGIIIETKGRFTVADRRKHLCVKKQHPKLDIRFVFTNSKSKLRKGAKSNYADWCERYGFKYCDRIIPDKWLKEKNKNITYQAFIPFTRKKIERKP